MRYQVTASDLTAIRLLERETMPSVLQNIAVLLSTRKGTVPLYRSFGLSQLWLDKPTPRAKAMMVAEIREEIEKWEPRAHFVDISFSEDVSRPGVLIPTVEVEIDAE